MLRRLLAIVVFVFVLLLVLPYLIPLSESRIAPEQLATDGGRFVVVDGVKTYVVERGPRDGIPMLFMHGFLGSTFSARHQLDVFVAAGYRVIAYDRPGFGLSDKPYDFDYSSIHQADFAAHLLDALAIPQAIIWGHSAGGGVLAHFALRHPTRVTRLLIVDGAILGQSSIPSLVSRAIAFPPIYRWGRIGLRIVFTEERLAGFLRDLVAEPARVTPEMVKGYWRLFQTANWEHGVLGQTRDLRDARAETFSDQQLSSLTARAIIIWGAQDKTTVLADGQRLKQLLPNATLHVIPDAGHLPMEEAPEPFNQIAVAALTGN